MLRSRRAKFTTFGVLVVSLSLSAVASTPETPTSHFQAMNHALVQAGAMLSLQGFQGHFTSAGRVSSFSIASEASTTCTPDSLGYCVASRNSDVHSITCINDQGLPLRELSGSITYGILTPDGSIANFTERFFDGGSCQTTFEWTPEDPATFYGDPNLP